MTVFKLFLSILLFSFGAIAKKNPPPPATLKSELYFSMPYTIVKPSSYDWDLMTVQIFSDNTIKYSETAKHVSGANLTFHKDGYYLHKFESYGQPVERRITIGANWEYVRVVEISANGTTENEYKRVEKAVSCAMKDGQQLCKGDVIGSGRTFITALSNSARYIGEIYLNLKGEIEGLQGSVNYGVVGYHLISGEILSEVNKVDKNLPCHDAVCVGAELKYSFRDRTSTPVKLVGFMKGEVVVEALENQLMLFSKGDMILLSKVFVTGFDKGFEKTVNQDCDDLSVNQKKAIFEEAGKVASDQCAKETSFNGCVARIYCNRTWGCGYEEMFERVAKGQCKIFGFTQPYVSSPIQ